MLKIAVVTLAALVMSGCGHAAMVATPAFAGNAAALSKAKSTPDNAVLTPDEVKAAKAALSAALEKRTPDDTVTVGDEVFNRTAVPGILQFRAIETTVGFSGHPFKKQVSGTVDLKSGKVTVAEDKVTTLAG